MILLKRNHRLFNYQQVFGSTTNFLPTLFVGADTINDIEPVGSVLCTCYTFDKIASAETGFLYDHNYLWMQMIQAGKATSNGASPADAFSVGTKGIKRIATGEIDKFPAYFQVDVGQYDFFTNVKSAIQIEFNKGNKRPVGIGTHWYAEWEYVTVLPLGKTRISDHEWEIVGWDEEHPDCFKIDSHEGYYKYMPRDVFNSAMDATYGSVALTIAQTSQESIDFLKEVNYSYIQAIIDSIYNALKIIQAKINQLKTPVSNIPIITPKSPTLNDFCNAIKDYEGKPGDRNYRNNNPFNAKFSPVGYLPKYGDVKKDSDGFAIFPSWDLGFLYGENLVKEKISKNPTWTIYDYFSLFHAPKSDGNDPVRYAQVVAKNIGVQPTFLIKDLV